MNTIVTMDLFGDTDVGSMAKMRRRVNRQKELLQAMKRAKQKLPLQYSLQMRIRKNPRKNNYSIRSSVTRNEAQCNTEQWTDLDVLHAHIELLEDFLRKFEDNQFERLSIKEQYDYWSWIERDEGDFTLYDCLALSGFRSPDVFIDGLRQRRPAWLELLEVIDDNRRFSVVCKMARKASKERAPAQVA
jgi:hypothetical protein